MRTKRVRIQRPLLVDSDRPVLGDSVPRWQFPLFQHPSRTRFKNKGQRGGTLLEFVVIAPFFFMMLVGIVAAGSLFFTHNAFVDATRRGARYASMQAATNPAGSTWTTPGGGCDTTSPSLTAIKNYAIYGNAAGTGTNVSGLQPDNICVQYYQFGVQTGTVTVSVINYNYNFVIPGLSRVIAMPPYRTTVPGESAGAAPSVCPD